jgi:hypothetical protein
LLGDVATAGKEVCFGGLQGGDGLVAGGFMGLVGIGGHFEVDFDLFNLVAQGVEGLLGGLVPQFGFFAADEDGEVLGEAVYQGQPQDGANGADHAGGQVFLFGQVFDLFAVEEEQVGDAEGQDGFDVLVPALGEDFGGEFTIAADFQGVAAIFGQGLPGAGRRI